LIEQGSAVHGAFDEIVFALSRVEQAIVT